jgi:type II secretory pathway pseudopilin PulG
MKKNRAITLIELMVAMFLAGIVTLLFLSLFQLMRPAMSQAEFSYLLSADVEERLDQLRNELSDTALGAISVTPASSGNPSGFSFPSFRDSKGAPVLDESGSPIWQQQVYVYLDPAGKVVSWQEPHITKVPVPASRAPFPATGPTHVLLNDAVKPNAELTGLPSTCGYQPAQSGGLQLQFLRRVYDGNGLYKLVASDVSPASVSSGSSAGLDCSGNSGLLQLNFQVYQIAPDGKPNYLNISLRVRPRY